jgi:dipeptidase D
MIQQVVNDIKTELKRLNLEVVFEKLDSVPPKVMPSIAQYYL